MESKKSPKADLQNKRWLFLGIGSVLSLVSVIGAFEYTSGNNSIEELAGNQTQIFEEVIEIPPTDQPPPPPPKPIQQPQITEVPDEEEIEEEIEVDLDMEVQEEEEIEEVVYEEEEEEEVEEIFTIVEQQADYPGGIAKFYKFVGKKMKYPSTARRMNVQGKVYVQFVVDTDGSITDVKAMKGIGSGCDEEAVRVVKSSPKWNPGKQRGRAVKVRRIIPIVFKLN